MINNIPQADEWLAAALTTSDIPGHRFRLEANSKIGSTKTPLLILEMVNGVFPSDIPLAERTQASLTEGEAVALWDAVSRTIRLRPGAMDPMPVPPVARSTLSVPTVVSGQACPENGHWIGYCNGKQYEKMCFKGRPMPVINVMQARPYRWLPDFVNAWLEQRGRLPMIKVALEARWRLDRFFGS